MQLYEHQEVLMDQQNVYNMNPLFTIPYGIENH